MTDAPKYILRDLPGVADFAALLNKVDEHPNPNWAPEFDLIMPTALRLQRDLFGLTDGETRGYGLRGEAVDRWDAHFDDLDGEVETIIAAMLELGWDVTDGQGDRFEPFLYLDRAIVCAAKGLAGRLPDAPISDEEAEARATGWAASLEAEAANFHSKSRKGRDR